MIDYFGQVVARKFMENWIEYDVLMKTETDGLFTLRVWARGEVEAKSKSKKLSQGCRVVGLIEVPSKKQGVSQ